MAAALNTYLRYLLQPYLTIGRTPMTTRNRERRPRTPAYYLGRPAGLWLAALAPRHGATGSPASQAAPRW